MADILGYRPDMVSLWERGVHPVPSPVSLIVTVLTAYGIGIETVREGAA